MIVKLALKGRQRIPILVQPQRSIPLNPPYIMHTYLHTMIRILFFVLLLPTTVLTQSLNLESPIRFLALGDSYTIGQNVAANARWPIQLSDSLSARGFVIDTLRIIATTGWRTDNLINAITNKNLEDQEYNLVSVLIGVNNQYQGRPFSQYIDEFPALLDSAIRYAGGEKTHVFVVSIPDYAYTPFGQQNGDPDEISMELDQYNVYNKHVADSMDITYFDITPISRLGLQIPSYVAGDGLHPSGIQYTEWVKLMLATIDNQTSGITQLSIDHNLAVNVFPNPATESITIEIPPTTDHQLYRLRLFDLTGKLILEQNMSGRLSEVSLVGMPEGLYLIKLNSGERQTIRKLYKQD